MRRLASLAAASTVLLVAVAGPALADDTTTTTDSATTSDAGNANRFNLTAQGNGMFFEYRGQAAPATDNISASPWAAYATVTSAGLSRAFAGLPYFGSFLQTIPATVNGLSGGATPPLPPLPGYTESKYPAAPEGHENQGPYSIQATSDQFVSNAKTTSGFSPDASSPRQQIYATAHSEALPDGSVVSTATAGVEAFTMGPLSILRFGNAETVTEHGDGKPVFTSSQDLGTFEVAGVKVGVTQNGFTVGSSSTAVPAAEGLKTVNTVLAKAGMEIAYIPRTVSRDTDGVTSVLSGALRVKLYQDAPAEGPTTLTYVFGRASVSTSDVKDDFGGDGGLPIDVPTVPTVPPVPADAGGVVDTPATPALDSSGLGTGSSTSDSSGLPPVTAGDTGSTTGSGAPQATGLGLVPTSGTPLRGSNSSLFYLVLVVAGAGVVIGQQVFSRFGVHLLMRAT